MTITPYDADRMSVVVIDTGWSPGWDTGTLVHQQDFHGKDDDARSAVADAHGAMVADVILSLAPQVDIIHLKVFPDDGGGASLSTVESALRWVAENAAAYNVAAVNLSLGSGHATAPAASLVSDELAALKAQGVLASIAAGNGGTAKGDGVSMLAADPNGICVSASTGDGTLAPWSQRSPTLTDICADGAAVRVADAAGAARLVNGTSFAAPAVAAAIALAQDAAMDLRGSRLTQEEFLAFARDTGRALDGGYRELDVDALVNGVIAALRPVADGGDAATDTAEAAFADASFAAFAQAAPTGWDDGFAG